MEGGATIDELIGTVGKERVVGMIHTYILLKPLSKGYWSNP